MKKITVLFFVLAVSAAPCARSEDAAASSTLTLEAAQKEALEHSPVYRRAQDVEKEAGWGQLEALSSGFLPRVSIEGQHFFNNEIFGSTNDNYTLINVQLAPNTPVVNFPGIYPNTTLTLGASLDLFDG